MTAPTSAEVVLLERLRICVERLEERTGLDWLYTYNLPDLLTAIEAVYDEEPAP